MSSVNLNDFSIQELKKMVKDKNDKVKKLEEEKEKEEKKLILAYKKLQKKEEKLAQNKKEIKQKSKSKSKSKSNSKLGQKKGFYDYYQECIKGKDIPKDTPEYFKKALEQAKKEYEKGIILEKSALANFAEKYVIDGEPRILPK